MLIPRPLNRAYFFITKDSVKHSCEIYTNSSNDDKGISKVILIFADDS